ncbi:hypothetical protein EXT68_02820 [Pectobacterium parmentieri]|uniref:Uncharacterized protein n=1 Tax=Pectobacterium parmentieri TaxID=1905730 RepID=A0A0H3I6U9_PECPM|nr:hypothetical protein [Pectobacterium parmentieri]AFI89651.1 Hypothetical protein W5S_1559 [Pectobacterium parmentieri]MBI0472075.1 hypothetical protein [Pectobacterium parmentieri]MBI0495184.1 hypothetical protein [Pectobacterium parmentieri]MBI0556236.1 hypothetical protein [Pectobacterium parmentieri]MBI0569320.1 hypothetical protein [Pectobacterium parmentieri]
MKLPRYLIVVLTITLGLVVWSQLSADSADEETTSTPAMTRTPQGKVPRAVATETRKKEELVDLFPVRSPPVTPENQTEKPQPVKKREPAFPLKAVGAWWENGERIVILSDGELNVLLCTQCQIKDAVRPGHVIVPTWRLITLSKDHLTVEWQPEHTMKRIELDDLTSRPAK